MARNAKNKNACQNNSGNFMDFHGSHFNRCRINGNRYGEGF